VTPIPSDNIHLSEVIKAPVGCAKSLIHCTRTFVDGCTDPKILEFVAAARSDNTRRAYQSDLRHFIARGGRIPATAEEVARYLADHASTLSMATLARRLAGIRSSHVSRGLPDPTKGELVRLTFRGVRRRFGRPQRRVAALSNDDLAAITASLGNSIKDIRDAAILLVGFAGAFRRSELVAMDCINAVTREDGFVVTIPRSKTDQEHRGRKVSIARGSGLLCPVAALGRWLAVSGISDGAMFRPVARGGCVLPTRLSAEAVALIVKQRVLFVGREPSRYSGHSLRAGFATAAVTAGVPLWRIKAQTGHASNTALERYIREGELFVDNSPGH
jgi:integrase